MPNKYELITTLYRETLNEVSNPVEWQKFLRTAGYNFRLDFDDLILLYAQKPESTAVLEIEKWNKRSIQKHTQNDLIIPKVRTSWE